VDKKDGRRTDTRDRIFQTALDLFAEEGVEAVSIRDITKQVGITAAAFYNHFESKNALLHAMYEYYRVRLIEPQSISRDEFERIARDSSPWETIAVAGQHFAAAMQNPVLEKLGRVISMEKERNPIAAEIAYSDRQKLIQTTEMLFGAFQENGRISCSDGKLFGRIVAYIMLGIAEDNKFFCYMRDEDPVQILNRQQEAMKQILDLLLEDDQ
jgi:AcrR family transcriptional regulator